MKKLINYSILFLLSLVIFSCGGPTIDADSDESKLLTATRDFLMYKGSPFSGTLVKYHENGQLNWEENFKDGKKDGIDKKYNENGQLEKKQSFKYNKKDGVSEEYYKNGQLEEKGNWKEGKPDGVFEYYHEDGDLEKKINYKDGRSVD
jgi:antitoxin component YwqK of YwqJK toxin-antitoxin module